MKHSTNYEEVEKYCNDVISNKIISGNYAKKACKRYLNDIKNSRQEGSLYYLDEAAADEAISFAEGLRIPDQNGQELRLLPWQKFIYYNLWGWRLKADSDTRRFRQTYIEVARKNGKTTAILFPFILLDFFTTPSSESYFVEADDKQAIKNYNDLIELIKINPEIKQAVNITTQSITFNGSRIMFFGSDCSAIDGYKNSLSVVDEYHAYSTDKIIQAFRKGGRARKNSLVISITSAGNDISTPCYAENQKAKKILNGLLTEENYFTIIYSADDGDDWQDENILQKANPSMGGFLKKENLIADLHDAQITPSHKQDYISKTLGIWSSGYSSWVGIDKIEQNKGITINEEQLKNQTCIGSIDLSSVNDFTAFTLCFKICGKYFFKHQFYIPETTVAERYRNENINITEWIDKKLITVIPGSTIDYNFIFNDIKKAYQEYNLIELCYDRYLATEIINRLNSELPDIPNFAVKQDIINFSPITKQYEKLLIDGEIVENSPILKWMIGNVEIKPDANNNYKPMKKGGAVSTNRIDGVITSIMSLSRLVANENVVVKDYTTDDILNSF